MNQSWLEYLPQKNGTVLVSLPGYFEADDFFAMYNIILEVLNPDTPTYGMDSMGVDGSFKKDGILVRMCSESAYDTCCFVYDPRTLSAEEESKVKGWLEQVVTLLHARNPKN